MNPDEEIEITFDKLGTLRQGMPTELGTLEPSSWGDREALREFYRDFIATAFQQFKDLVATCVRSTQKIFPSSNGLASCGKGLL